MFQSTRPHKGATCWFESNPPSQFVSIHAPPQGRDQTKREVSHLAVVSIHAPPQGRDLALHTLYGGMPSFNPRAPTRARPPTPHPPCWPCWFQSTRPHKGATSRDLAKNSAYMFQSTRPHKGATPMRPRDFHFGQVSIHAPPQGRDFFSTYSNAASKCFNPRAPTRARPADDNGVEPCGQFQSTRPHKGATAWRSGSKTLTTVSIHAPPQGRDSRPRPNIIRQNRFNPRAPTRARRYDSQRQGLLDVVSIHAPPQGRDLGADVRPQRGKSFNPRAPTRARPSPA